MQAYREAFSEGGTRLLLAPEGEFFRFFRQGMQADAPANGAAPPATGAAAAPAAPSN
jgi:membrane protease subunit HflC